MEHRIEIPTLGRGILLHKMLSKRLPRLDQKLFTFGDVELGDHSVIIEFDFHEDALLMWALNQILTKDGLNLSALGTTLQIQHTPSRKRKRSGKFVKDDPETTENEAWTGGKSPAKKKAAPRKRAPAKKKAAAKKK